MSKQEIDFIKRADNFIVIKDGEKQNFTDYRTAATFYNENISTVKKSIEISAVCGFVGLTIAYHYNF